MKEIYEINIPAPEAPCITRNNLNTMLGDYGYFPLNQREGNDIIHMGLTKKIKTGKTYLFRMRLISSQVSESKFSIDNIHINIDESPLVNKQTPRILKIEKKEVKRLIKEISKKDENTMHEKLLALLNEELRYKEEYVIGKKHTSIGEEKNRKRQMKIKEYLAPFNWRSFIYNGDY